MQKIYKDGVTFHPVCFFLVCCSANIGPTVNAQRCSPAMGLGYAWYRLAVSESESGKSARHVKLCCKDLIVCTKGGLGSGVWHFVLSLAPGAGAQHRC